MNNEIIITNHNPQDITITQDENQLIFINGGGEVIGITDVKVNGESVVTNNIAYVIVPTKTSELQNNSGFLTSETDPTVPSIVKTISQADINNWNNKQNALVSGSTIKTINNESLLGSGNINVGGSTYEAGNGIDITNNIISNTITSYNDLTDLPSIPTNTSDLINDSDFVSEDELSEVAFTGSYNSLSDTPIIPDTTSDLTNNGADGSHPFIANYDNSNLKGLSINNGRLSWLNGIALTNVDVANYSDLPTKTSDLTNDGADGAHPFIPNNDTLGVYGLKALTSNGLNLQYIIGQGNTTNTLQDQLVSGANIKTINNQSILGSGNLNITNILDYKGSLLLYYGNTSYNRSWSNAILSIENLNSTFGNIKSGYTRWWRLIAWKNDNQSGGNGLGIGLFSTNNYIRFNFTGSQGSYVCSDYLNTGTDELFEFKAILPPTSTSTSGTLYSLILQVYDVPTGTDPNNI